VNKAESALECNYNEVRRGMRREREKFNAKTKIIFSFRIKRMLLVFVN
jgi:hypothetical protein